MAKARRAKKSKMPKKLLIIPSVLIGISSLVILSNSSMKTNIIGNVEEKLETYNRGECIQDIFTENGVKYLPIKYGGLYEQIKKEDLERELNAYGMKIESVSSDVIGTGTEIRTKNATYVLLVYGDIDGNGQVNVRDVQCIVKHLLYGGDNELTGVKRMAANVENEKEDVINVRDAQRIVQFLLGKKEIIDSMPTSDIANDKEVPVITLNGEKEVTINVFEEYKEEGATATDNLDPNVTDKIVIDTSKVNTNKPGDYEVTYNVKDASGNVAQTLTRIVHVVDYVKDINIKIYPNQQYVEGEKITLNNMVAYAVKAYGGEETSPIDINEITVEPTIAALEMTKISITYKNITKEIPINVTERKPIITLNYDNAENVKIKVGTTYDTEGITAWDETDQTELRVIADGTVDVNVPGKYVINYTTEPNSLGKVGTRVRTVEVIDYITSAGVEFETDSTFKTQYVDGDVISLSGLKVYANYAYAGRKLLDNKLLSTNIETVVYDRNNENNNKNRDLIITYKEYDEVDKKENTYSSTGFKINIVKKFETIEEAEISGAVKAGDLYDYVWVSRIKSGENEENLTVDKIDITLENPDSDVDGFKARVWAEPAYEKDANGEVILNSEGNPTVIDGYVDIYLVGVSSRQYNITITPKVKTQYTQEKKLDPVTITTNSEIDIIELGDFTIESGEDRFKTGDSITANVTFKHRYGKEGQAGYHDVVIDTVLANKLENIKIQNVDGNTISGITGTYDAQTKKITITANDKTYTGSNAGETIKIVVSAKNRPEVKAEKETQIYAKSIYQVSVGDPNIEGIQLSLKQLTKLENKGYEIAKAGEDDYYTLLPITMMDQYPGIKNINVKDILNGRISADDTVHTASQDSCIKVLGFNGNKTEAKDDEPVMYLGIAINNREDELEAGNAAIKVTFEGTVVGTFTPISIQRKDVSSIRYSKQGNEEAKDYCYKNMIIANVSSGARQSDLSSDDARKIGCIIEKEGRTDPITNISKQITKDADAGYTVTVTGGIATIKFWAKEEGVYYITPYIEIDNKQVKIEGESKVTVEIDEDETVTELTFAGKSQLSQVALNASEKRKIEYWHTYKDNNDNVIERRQIKTNSGVDYNQITIEIPNYEDDIDIKLISESVYIVPPVADGVLIDEIGININESILSKGINIGNNVPITIKIKDKPGNDGKVTCEQTVNATVAEKAVISGLRVGRGETITIYTTNGNPSDNDKTRGKKYTDPTTLKQYTLVPITYITQNGTEVYSNTLNMEHISEVKSDTNNNNKITFVDNVNRSDWEEKCIILKGFNKDGNPVANDNDSIAYIGIAIADDEHKKFFSNNVPDEYIEEGITQEEWVKLQYITVHYYIDGTAGQPIILTLDSDYTE